MVIFDPKLAPHDSVRRNYIDKMIIMVCAGGLVCAGRTRCNSWAARGRNNVLDGWARNGRFRLSKVSKRHLGQRRRNCLADSHTECSLVD